jgi:CheY-like chemotaxis protein
MYRERPGPHAPIVVVTAAREAAERATQIAADGVLPKPFRLAELLAVVETYAGQP